MLEFESVDTLSSDFDPVKSSNSCSTTSNNIYIPNSNLASRKRSLMSGLVTSEELEALIDDILKEDVIELPNAPVISSIFQKSTNINSGFKNSNCVNRDDDVIDDTRFDSEIDSFKLEQNQEDSSVSKLTNDLEFSVALKSFDSEVRVAESSSCVLGKIGIQTANDIISDVASENEATFSSDSEINLVDDLFSDIELADELCGANDNSDTESSECEFPAPDPIIERVCSLGPKKFVDEIKETMSPETLMLEIFLQTIPEGLHHASEDAKWEWVLRFLHRNVYVRKRIPNISSFEDAIRLIGECRRIIVLTGAGISVSCGIPDFRSAGGLYEQIQKRYDLPEPECMFDIEFFRNDPEPFFSFAKEILPKDEIQPSLSHHFISALEKSGTLLDMFTQNIDTLEEISGIQKVVYCHGSFKTSKCLECEKKFCLNELKDLLKVDTVPLCRKCGGIIKPDIVFFGEPLPKIFDDRLAVDCTQADLLLVIGSSLKVHPVSMIPDLIPPGVPQVLINRESLDHTFDIELLGDCDLILGEIAKRLALFDTLDKFSKHDKLYHTFKNSRDANVENIFRKTVLPNQHFFSSVSFDSIIPSINETISRVINEPEIINETNVSQNIVPSSNGDSYSEIIMMESLKPDFENSLIFT